LRKAAIIVSRGSFNNLFQVATLIRALTSSPDVSVRVFFRDEALVKLSTGSINELNFSEAYRGLEESVVERLRIADFDDLRGFLRDSKEHGDDVAFYACASSMYMIGRTKEDLIPEVDDIRDLTSFLHEEVMTSDVVMTF
jgi:peroxiredoxin family protein